MAAAEQQREWQLEDRTEERAYNRTQLDESRAYDRAQLDEARAYSRTVLGNLVVDATNAGFNPLTLVRSGAASNYNAGAGFAPLSSTPLTASPSPARQAPVRQAVGGSVAADAVNGIGDFISNFDPFADSKREQEYRLVESQIAALNASALSGVARGAGSFAQGDFERRPSGAGASLSRSGLGQPAKWQAGDVNVTNPFQSEPVNKDWSDAATWEQRYGEPGSWIGGAVVGAADAWDFAKRKTLGSWNKPVPKDSAIRKAARWVDDLFGLGPNRKTGRLSKRMNGGGGGW
ncbi:hypothetical protein ATN81_07015 [Agrobacterium pusense]|uniref:hypothetical protein n=1 Tax=Agrobacterium pusense TaxID=648995 RepID=UPI00092A0763|nr:hypothetical protein [Agrobacterium pusense]OJH55751.1 hypothetical protein ATN81_07015 [Agrobacterium pusense]OJH60358.1 hypothetical protein BA725_07930 [Agrobacterium pusense]